MQLIREKSSEPWKVLIYGTPGIGKSTLGSFAPKPVFIDLEKGLSRIDCVRTPVIKNYDDMVESIKALAESDEFETIVFDTLDSVEHILTKKILDDDDRGKNSLGQFDFGKGYELLKARFVNFIKQLEYLNDHGKNVLLIGHETIKTYNDPTCESYDRYQIAVHNKVHDIIFASMDAVLFANYEAATRSRGEKFGSEKHRAVGTGRRIVNTVESPAFVAKNRFGLEPIEELDKSLFGKIK